MTKMVHEPVNSALPLSILFSGFLRLWPAKPRQPVDHREKAERLNQLAASIRTAADARRLVDFVAGVFVKELPHALTTRTLRERIARAEFACVALPPKRIPESRIAEAWNIYAAQLQAPKESQVTGADLHNLRDGLATSAQIFWRNGRHNVWTAPAIYATRADGRIDVGCRAIESIRILWDLANLPKNVTAARVRITNGVIVSDTFRRELEKPSSEPRSCYVSAYTSPRDPIEIAQQNYIARNGTRAFRKLITSMLDHALVM